MKIIYYYKKRENVRIEDYFLDAKDSTQIKVKGEALAAGTATVNLSGSFEGKADEVELQVPVYSGHTIGTDVLIGSFKGNTRLTLPIDKSVKGLSKDEFVMTESKFNKALVEGTIKPKQR